MQAPQTAAAPAPTLKTRIGAHIDDVASLLRALSPADVAPVVELIHETRREGGVVYVFGNGGSAATAMHFCNDLHANCADHNPPLRVQCLASNLSTLLALANDTGYENVFVGQLQSLAPEDTVIAISASGNSENCVRAVARARELGARSVGLVGFDGGRLAELCAQVIHIPRHDYLAVEDVHSVLCHAIARGLRPAAA
ncbi:Phosphoheptose isomerase 1 [Enhygromyxa salina]|uniref:Phosphoheptose isomerase 1 n=1 Tax=Enhygromyxa salina TaxID=215803 RepID=A0A2S9YGK0_9BACT|nr:SIS domain-containing protein [Enhygromyxa salina]PRQ04237.1 Phosphoheptose isomerase 1 [Enhygromyxa salina]